MAKLLTNGTVLSFDDETQSIKVLRSASILIKGDEIAALGENIDTPSDVEIVNMTGKILTPGFINTHIHSWQSAFRTSGPNTTLAEYFSCFSQFSPAIKSFSAEDIYVSCLASYYEGLNGGVTGYVDHAHNTWNLEVMSRGYDAAVDSGARVWWCPAIGDREACSANDQWKLMDKSKSEKVANDPLVSFGLAYDSLGGSSASDRDHILEMTKKLELEAITLHLLGGPWPVGQTGPSAAAELNLQESELPVIFSHGGFVTDSDKAALRKHNWNLSITPESEMHFGHGQETSFSIQDQASLGIDTNWTFAGDILAQARLWLQHARGTKYTETLNKGLIPKENPLSVEDAFLLATREGGRALRRDDIGVLKVGAKADIVAFDGDSPNMLGWTDPVAAIVLHANVGDIKHVMVGGQFRKRDGELVLKKGSWAEFSKTFAEMARRIQRENTQRPPQGAEFFGTGEWGEVERMTTIANAGA